MFFNPVFGVLTFGSLVFFLSGGFIVEVLYPPRRTPFFSFFRDL